MFSGPFHLTWLISSFHFRDNSIKGGHNSFFKQNTQEKTIIHNINILSTEINCCYAVDNFYKTPIINEWPRYSFGMNVKKP